jgi:phi13 family phage major tail protein
MSNRVTYGLEDVHIAFKGVAQRKSIEVTAGCGTDGEVTVTVTGAPLTGGSEACVVPLSTESHGTVEKVASAVCNVLNNNADVGVNYVASHLGGVIYLTAKVVAANDNTLNIAFTPGSTGVTVNAAVDVAAGAAGWGVPTPIPGAVRFTPTAQGQESTFYADNIPYFVITANNGYTAELEMALVPDAILATMLGWQVDTNGMLVELADGIPTRFALMGQVEGDDKNRRFVYYDCQASRPAKEHSTKGETIEPKTDVLNLTIFPIEIGGIDMVKGVMELSASNTAAYNAFFNAVYTPVFS